MPNNQWNIDDNGCNPWSISEPPTADTKGLYWAPQYTVPLPFEAINDLFAAAVREQKITFIPTYRPSARAVSVNQKFFQSSPNGIKSDSVKADVLGFFSLVLTYIKFTEETDPPVFSTRSPKFSTFIMPRTEFVNLYAQVKSTLPGTGTLYDLVKVLACYKNDEDDEVE